MSFRCIYVLLMLTVQFYALEQINWSWEIAWFRNITALLSLNREMNITDHYITNHCCTQNISAVNEVATMGFSSWILPPLWFKALYLYEKQGYLPWILSISPFLTSYLVCGRSVKPNVHCQTGFVQAKSNIGLNSAAVPQRPLCRRQPRSVQGNGREFWIEPNDRRLGVHSALGCRFGYSTVSLSLFGPGGILTMLCS